jgi:hypothetical protein
VAGQEQIEGRGEERCGRKKTGAFWSTILLKASKGYAMTNFVLLGEL